MAGRMFEIAFNIMGRMGPSFEQAFSSASGRMTQLNTRVSSLKAEMKALDAQQKKGTISVEQYATSYEKLSAQMAKAEKLQKNYAKAYALQDKANTARGNARANMVGAIETAAVVATPVYAAMNFEGAMSGVAKQVEGARTDTGELTDVYNDARMRVMQASKDMMIMPDSMAKAFAMAAKSGVKGMDNIDKFARMGQMMGTAFEAPAEEITEQFAKIGSARGISLASEEGIKRLEALADSVNYLDDQSNASGADIISVMKRISGTATSLLPTISDQTLAGMSTAMLHMGETSETAGTALNSLFTKVAAAPTQAKSFHGALAQVGLTAEELQANALKDGEGAILNLFERIGQLDAAARNNVLAELFGTEHIDTLSKISGNYEQFIEVMKMGNSEAAKGSMMKEFAIQSQNTSRQLEGLKAAATRAAIGFATVLLPDIKAAIGIVSQAVEWFAKFGKEHETIANTAVRLGAAVLGGTVALSGMLYVGWAVISPLVNLYAWMTKVQFITKAWTAAQWLWNAAMTAGRILLSIGSMLVYGAWMGVCTAATATWTAAQWLWNAAMTANPIGAMIVGIGLLVGAGFWLMQNWDTVKDWWTLLWDNPGAALQAFIDGIYAKFGKAMAWLGEKAAWVKNLFTDGNGIAVSADVSGGQIPAYAKGTIATTPHIGLFAEKGPEAVIPLDGSSRALSLWATAGKMLGVGGSSSSTFQDYACNPSGGSGKGDYTFVFSPNIHLDGGDSQAETKVRRAIDEAADDFEIRMEAFIAQQRRLGYA